LFEVFVFVSIYVEPKIRLLCLMIFACLCKIRKRTLQLDFVQFITLSILK